MWFRLSVPKDTPLAFSRWSLPISQISLLLLRYPSFWSATDISRNLPVTCVMGHVIILNSEVVYRNRDGHVIKFNFASNETDFILANSTFVNGLQGGEVPLSADLMYALFAYDVKQGGVGAEPSEVHNAVLQHAAWGKQGRQLIFIFENNIYYQSDVRSTSLRITSSGQEGWSTTGWPTGSTKVGDPALSPGPLVVSRRGEARFLSINDTLVPNMVLPQFTGSTYPKGIQYPYPMSVKHVIKSKGSLTFYSNIHLQAGQKNPEVKLLVVTCTERHTLKNCSLLNSSNSVRWVNRSQNASLLTVCDATIGVCVQTRGLFRDMAVLSGTGAAVLQGQEPLLPLSACKTRRQGDFNHITMFTKKLRSDKDEVRHLTSGDWEVTKIVAYDENNQIIYFLSTQPLHNKDICTGPLCVQCTLFVSTLGLFPRRCLTCGLKDECSFFEAEVSPDAQHAILYCKGPGVPAVLLLSFIDVNSYFILENNLPLRSALETKKTIRNETHTITNDNFALPLKLIYPPDFSESFLYGLLLIVDRSPGGQGVTDEFRLDWYLGLVGSEQVIVARLDGRGQGSEVKGN
ncbi:hypothetical protein F7725_005938 [Dissostichus mawsoni]|uniref:Dipeptidylpeptidase IV N-terminal domain-containing protein n=1 Tax=Dissostichus mawsoni TaxID=36200 RepID=A0A7J5YTU6_DISMA|nr:hypothetical protein F7725_005938 [Dissostichus mawsoni]